MLSSVPQAADHQARSEQLLYKRDGLLCVLLTAACFLLAYPFVEMGFIDDWAYVKMAQVFPDRTFRLIVCCTSLGLPISPSSETL